MTKTEEQMRAEFECWYSHNGESDVAIQRTESGSYYLMQAQAAWMAWQACQRQNDVEIERLREALEEIISHTEDNLESEGWIIRLIAETATKALEGGKDE